MLARLDSNVQQIARDKADLTLQDARRTLERNKVLVQNNAAPVNQTQAVELAAQMAELSLRQAEQDLADRTVIAPVSYTHLDVYKRQGRSTCRCLSAR